MIRKSLLLFLVAATTLLFAGDKRPFDTWTQYLGGADSSQYSSLAQINRTNVKQLGVAWTYAAGGNVLFNPIVVDGVMYVLAKNNLTVALDAATGKELWTHANQGRIGTRGISYWESKDRSDRRLVYLSDGCLTEINAKTGESITTFGENGRVDLRTDLDRDPTTIRPLQFNNPGRIFEDIIIQPLPAGGASYESNPADIHAYDVRTGKVRWIFHTVPRPGEFGYETWPKDAYKSSGGVHNWSEMTVDEQRGIAYIPLGTARYDFYGGNRHGQNLFGNCLLALDARTGKRLWHFQLLHHDLWDYDNAPAPKLLTVRHDGKNVDAVAQATKFGYLYVFNRVTGAPLWPIEERPVPKSDVQGEEAWPTQPIPSKPPPYARQSFTEKDINPLLSQADQDALREELKNYRNEGLFTPPSLRGTIELPGHNGGSNWGKTAVDPTKGTMYIQSNDQPTLMTLQPPPADRNGAPPLPPPAGAPPDFIRYASPIKFMANKATGMSIISPPWSQLTAYDLNTGTILWQVPDGEVTALARQGKTGLGSQAPRGGVVVTAGGLIFLGTSSDRKLRAYDQDTGKVLWEFDLPAACEGVPAVYQVNGREYIVVTASGNGYLTQPNIPTDPPIPAPAPGAYWVFALPK